jgi:hypothetical protein
VLVLGFQALAVLSRSGRWLWPFMDYPMYAGSHREGERIPARHTVYAITEDGREIPMNERTIGVDLFVFEAWGNRLMMERQPTGTIEPRPERHWPLKDWLKSTTLFKLFKSKEDPDFTSIFVQLLEQKQGVKITRLRVEDAAVIVTRHGMEPAPEISVVVDLPLDHPDQATQSLESVR